MSSKIEHSLTLPAGPISAKYQDFVFNEDLFEMAFIGTFNTAKSTALVDWLILSGLEYPGANLVLTRAKLSDLRRTTLTKYLSRAGKFVVDDFNKNDAVITFPEINGQQSRLYMFGLDRHDLTEVLKSFEPFRVAVEESNEVPSKALDLLLGRARQKVRHRERTNAWLVAKMAAKWGVSRDRAQEVLGISDSEMQNYHYGSNQLKHVFNPEGNDHTWKRAVGVPYPKPEDMGPEWVKKNVGIREFYIPGEKLGMYEYLPGDYVSLSDGSRAFVAKEQENNVKVELVNGDLVNKHETMFIGQRAAIFAFTKENWSRNKQSDRAFLYMQDPSIREQYFEAKIDTKKGLIFPEFERHSHVVPPPSKDIPANLRGVVAVDHGFRHPTVALFGVLTKKPHGGLLILKEYMVSGRSAYENAYEVKGLVPPYLQNVSWWGDPSMWKTEPTSLSSVADDYSNAGIPLYKADNNLEYTVNNVKELLRVNDDYRTGEAVPRLFISEDCQNLIHALETCTHQHLSTSRDNWIVDMIDGLRYLVAGAVNETSGLVNDGEVLRPNVRVWSWN